MGKRRDELAARAALVPELAAIDQSRLIALKAQGARIYDVDNSGYVDYTGAAGAAIVGYANQFVLDAVRKVLAAGVPDGLHVALEVELAEALQKILPWAGTFSFCRNHDDAMRLALQWLCTSSGKDMVLAMHGGARFTALDWLAGAQETPRKVRRVPGWDVDAVQAAVSAGASKLAAFVLDPLLSGVGVVPPPPGAMTVIADACRANGVALLVDERVSGFRVSRGGAVALEQLTPDVAVLGGALAGGFPFGVVAVAPGVAQLSSGEDRTLPPPHPISLAAADAVLSILRNDTTYERLESRTAQLADGIVALSERFSRGVRVNRSGSVFAVYVSPDEVSSAAAAEQADQTAYRRLATGLKEEGVLLPAQPGVPAFVSNAHGAKEIDETLAACERVMMRLHQEDLP